MLGIFDSHAHYDDARFDEDRDELLCGMKDKGVSFIVNVSAKFIVKRQRQLTMQAAGRE